METKTIHHFSKFADKFPSTAERVNISLRNFLKKLLYEKGNADWLSELLTVIKQYNNTIHHSIKMTPFQASRKSNEKKSIQILKTREENLTQNIN